MRRAVILAAALTLGASGAAWALLVPKPSPTLEAEANAAAEDCDSCTARKSDKARLREYLKEMKEDAGS